METETNYTDKKQQVFVCCDKKGYITRLKPLNAFEKQLMYNDYPLFIQIGFRSNNSIKLWNVDGSTKNINPNTIPFNKWVYGSKNISTISLDSKKEKKCETEVSAN